MKKLISIIAALASCVSLAACSKSPESSGVFAGVELVRTGMADRIVADNLEELEKYSDIAVVGKFIDDAVSDNTYTYSDYFEKEILTFPRSYNTIEVKQVLMGDVKIGDKLVIEQLYGIDDVTLYSVSDLTPMVKGDEWIFFLCKDTDSDICGYTADSDSRFPTKISASRNSRLAFADSWQLGVYDEADFRQDIYNEIVEKYDV